MPRFSAVQSFDGQTLRLPHGVQYSIHAYLGGGAAGTVYEATQSGCTDHFAIKIVNPIGYKLLPAAAMSRCTVIHKGLSASGPSQLTAESVWWLLDPATRTLVAAYEDARSGGALRELPLPLCVHLWGYDPVELRTAAAVTVDEPSGSAASSSSAPIAPNPSNADSASAGPPSPSPSAARTVMYRGRPVVLPRVPAKYLKFLRARAGVYREISAMSALGKHENVVELHEVLEHVQDSKTTLFLVLEMAAGGELFDRIRPLEGVSEETAAGYMRQLLSGVAFCHAHGVVHRDLKPENLLLGEAAPGGDGGEHQQPVLKIADFGLSALTAVAAEAEAAAETEFRGVVLPGAGSPYASPRRGPMGLSPGGGGGAVSLMQLNGALLESPLASGLGGRRRSSATGSDAVAAHHASCDSVSSVSEAAALQQQLHSVHVGGGSTASAAPSPALSSAASSVAHTGQGGMHPLSLMPQQQQAPMRLKSVVGSPFYCAPEVLQCGRLGAYDGAKADAWSTGVILHAMLAGALPFSENVLACPRFSRFKAWLDARDTALAVERADRQRYEAELGAMHAALRERAARHAERRAARRGRRECRRGEEAESAPEAGAGGGTGDGAAAGGAGTAGFAAVTAGQAAPGPTIAQQQPIARPRPVSGPRPGSCGSIHAPPAPAAASAMTALGLLTRQRSAAGAASALGSFQHAHPAVCGVDCTGSSAGGAHPSSAQQPPQPRSPQGAPVAGVGVVGGASCAAPGCESSGGSSSAACSSSSSSSSSSAPFEPIPGYAELVRQKMARQQAQLRSGPMNRSDSPSSRHAGSDAGSVGLLSPQQHAHHRQNVSQDDEQEQRFRQLQLHQPPQPQRPPSPAPVDPNQDEPSWGQPPGAVGSRPPVVERQPSGRAGAGGQSSAPQPPQQRRPSLHQLVNVEEPGPARHVPINSPMSQQQHAGDAGVWSGRTPQTPLHAQPQQHHGRGVSADALQLSGSCIERGGGRQPNPPPSSSAHIGGGGRAGKSSASGAAGGSPSGPPRLQTPADVASDYAYSRALQVRLNYELEKEIQEQMRSGRNNSPAAAVQGEHEEVPAAEAAAEAAAAAAKLKKRKQKQQQQRDKARRKQDAGAAPPNSGGASVADRQPTEGGAPPPPPLFPATAETNPQTPLFDSLPSSSSHEDDVASGGSTGRSSHSERAGTEGSDDGASSGSGGSREELDCSVALPAPPVAAPQSVLEFPVWFFPPHLSQAGKELICGLLHPNPERRLGVVAAMASDWLRTRQAPTTASPPPSLRQRNQTPLMPSPAAIVGIAGGGSAASGAFPSTPPLAPMSVLPLPSELWLSSTSGTPSALARPTPSARGVAPLTSGSARPSPSPRDVSLLFPELLLRREEDGLRRQSFFHDANQDDDARALPSLAPTAGIMEQAGGGSVPLFDSIVQRSTRFRTGMPARELLAKVEAILSVQTHPLRPPYSKLRQTVRVLAPAYRLEVLWGSVVVATMQLYMVPDDEPTCDCSGDAPGTSEAPLYLVDFLRGQLDCFSFKTLYEGIRASLSAEEQASGVAAMER